MSFTVKHGLAQLQLKECDLKRRLEDWLLNPEMSQFLRLHAREEDFSVTVLKARQFVDAARSLDLKSLSVLSRRRHLTMHHRCIAHRAQIT